MKTIYIIINLKTSMVTEHHFDSYIEALNCIRLLEQFGVNHRYYTKPINICLN